MQVARTDGCLQDRLDGQHGLPRRRLDELARRFAAVQAEVRQRRGAGSTGSMGWRSRSARSARSRASPRGVGQAYDHVLVLGIGGSALGARALLAALRPPAWNELDDEAREFFPRLTVLDNVDPDLGGRRAPAHRSAAGAGQRGEQVGRHRGDAGAVPGGAGAGSMRRSGPAASRHLVFTTDPERGALRELAGARGHRHAGGAAGGRAAASACSRRWGSSRPRWSASTSRRSWPARRRAVARAESDDAPRQPGRALRRRSTGRPTPRPGARIHVLMPYTDRLRDVGRVVPPALGREPGQAGRPGRTGGPRGPDAARRGGRHRPAQPGRSCSWKGRSTRWSPS